MIRSKNRGREGQGGTKTPETTEIPSYTTLVSLGQTNRIEKGSSTTVLGCITSTVSLGSGNLTVEGEGLSHTKSPFRWIPLIPSFLSSVPPFQRQTSPPETFILRNLHTNLRLFITDFILWDNHYSCKVFNVFFLKHSTPKITKSPFFNSTIINFYHWF